MNFSLIAIGFISILGQVVLLRELNVSFYGVELIYLLALGIWLLCTAAGVIIGRWLKSPSLKHIAGVFILLGIILPLDIVFIRASRIIFGGIPGAYLTFLQQLVIAIISILPAGLLSGLLFQWTAKTYIAANRTLASAYAIESVGGFIGGLFSTLFLMWGLKNTSTAILCALCSIMVSAMIMKGTTKSYVRRLAFILIGIFLALFWKSSPIDRWMTVFNHPDILESIDSPYGRITVTKLYNQISVFENDALAFETEGTDAEYFCHLAALQHTDPQNILVLGGGIEGIIREMAKHKPTRIDYVEINPDMLNIVTKHLPDNIRNSLKAPNVNIIFDDPRQYLKKSGKYDLILVGMPQPTSGQANRFYTREFFEQCSGKLNSGGILGFRLLSAENFWTLPQTKLNTSIHSALHSVFPYTLFLPGTTNIVTASRTPLPSTPEIMSARLQERKITTQLVSSNYIKYLFTNDRFSEIKKLLDKGIASFNTDTRPVCYQYTFIIWLSKFFPHSVMMNLSELLSNLSLKSPLLFLWMGVPVIFLLSRFRPTIRRAMLVAAAGFVGMIVETVLIIYYQAKYGVLYQNIGLLLMSFMAGLVAGSYLINKAHRQFVINSKSFRFYGIGLLIGFCILCLFIELNVLKGNFTGLPQISSLLAINGFLVAGIFAYVSLHEIEEQKKIISPLYAADLVGGCIGSLLGSLILIPLVGMDITARAMFLVAAFSVLLL